MAMLSFYYMCVFVFCCVAAVEENILIIASDEVFQEEREMADKRTPIHDIFDAAPIMYEREVQNLFGGGSYSNEEQNQILQAHNNYRKNVNPSAANMNALTWSPTLAKQAQFWSDRCIYKHPSKSQYPDYNGIGQNLYLKYGDTGGNRPPPITQPTDLWYGEVKDYHYAKNGCNLGKVCGHFTQVVWAATTEVGCGMTFCPTAISSKTYKNAWLVTCNYSPAGNVVGRSPYLSGTVCSQCKSGFCQDNLCSNCNPSDEGCDCQIECQNCGTRASGACNCDCQQGYFGDRCQSYCEDTHKYCGANPGWPKFWCGNPRFSFVDKYCPAMCKTCTPGDRQTEC